MESPLAGAWLKVERADAHIRELESMFPRRGGVKLHRFVANANAQAVGRQLVQIEVLKPPLTASVIVGETVYQLRSALDVATIALAKIHSPGTSTRNVGFPFAESAERLMQLGSKESPGPQRKIKKLAPAARDIINCLQPYRSGNPLLCGLNDLRNQDVHVEMVAVGSSAPVGNLLVTQDPDSLFGGEITGLMSVLLMKGDTRITDGAEFDVTALGCSAAEFAAEANKYVQLAMHVCFSNTKAFDGEPVIATLHQLRDLVQHILRALETTV